MENQLIICIGAALVDECYSCIETPRLGTSNPSKLHRSTGGVACNVASHLSLLGHNVELITHFGTDADGEYLYNHCKSNRMSIDHSVFNNVPTGKYIALLSPKGELFTGASASHIEELISPGLLENNSKLLGDASLIIMDCNLSKESLSWLLGFCKDKKIPCIIEPVSVNKSSRLRECDLDEALLITPNADELISISGDSNQKTMSEHVDRLLTRGVKNVWLRDGKNGSRIFTKEETHELTAPNVEIKDITGAGDAALAGWIHGWLKEKTPDECLRYGHSLASIILKAEGAIEKNLSAGFLEAVFKNYN